MVSSLAATAAVGVGVSVAPPGDQVVGGDLPADDVKDRPQHLDVDALVEAGCHEGSRRGFGELQALLARPGADG